jgi:hypothetical protein
MTSPEKNPRLFRRQETIESLTIEVGAYESAIADAECLGRGNLPHVELLRKTLEEMRHRLRMLKEAE